MENGSKKDYCKSKDWKNLDSSIARYRSSGEEGVVIVMVVYPNIAYPWLLSQILRVMTIVMSMESSYSN